MRNISFVKVLTLLLLCLLLFGDFKNFKKKISYSLKQGLTFIFKNINRKKRN